MNTRYHSYTDLQYYGVNCGDQKQPSCKDCPPGHCAGDCKACVGNTCANACVEKSIKTKLYIPLLVKISKRFNDFVKLHNVRNFLI